MGMIQGCTHDPVPNQPRIAAVYPHHIGRNTPYNSLKKVGVAPYLKSTHWCHSQQESAATQLTHTASGTETVGEADRALGMVPCGVCQACLVSPTCTPLAACPPSPETGTSPKHSPPPQPPRGGGEESTGLSPEGSQARVADWLRMVHTAVEKLRAARRMWAEKWAADKAAAGTVYSTRYGMQHSKLQWLRQSVRCPTARQHLDSMTSAAQDRMAELSWEQHHWVGPDIDVAMPESEHPGVQGALPPDVIRSIQGLQGALPPSR